MIVPVIGAGEDVAEGVGDAACDGTGVTVALGGGMVGVLAGGTGLGDGNGTVDGDGGIAIGAVGRVVGGGLGSGGGTMIGEGVTNDVGGVGRSVSVAVGASDISAATLLGSGIDVSITLGVVAGFVGGSRLGVALMMPLGGSGGGCAATRRRPTPVAIMMVPLGGSGVWTPSEPLMRSTMTPPRMPRITRMIGRAKIVIHARPGCASGASSVSCSGRLSSRSDVFLRFFLYLSIRQ